MTIRNVPLAERRADAADLSRLISEHRHDGSKCKPACAELTRMRRELREVRQEIATWFAPGEDQGTLF